MNENKNTSPLSVKCLRQNGWTVNVYHYRRFKFVCQYSNGKIKVWYGYHRYEESFSGNVMAECLATGGYTHIKAVHPDTGVVFSGVAMCHNSDNYNKKIGVELALKDMFSI